MRILQLQFPDSSRSSLSLPGHPETTSCWTQGHQSALSDRLSRYLVGRFKGWLANNNNGDVFLLFCGHLSTLPMEWLWCHTKTTIDYSLPCLEHWTLSPLVYGLEILEQMPVPHWVLFGGCCLLFHCGGIVIPELNHNLKSNDLIVSLNTRPLTLSSTAILPGTVNTNFSMAQLNGTECLLYIIAVRELQNINLYKIVKSWYQYH
jgi:hypothetical protein